MTLAISSAIIIILWAIVLTILERIIPYQKGYKIFREGYWMDLFWYTIVQSYFCGILIANIIQALDAWTGFSHFQIASKFPLIIQIIFFFLIHEIWQYWFHRLQHSNKFFWRTHEAAHATPEVDWLVGSRSHAIEILIAQTFEFAPIILLGASPEVPIIKATLDSVWGMYNHSNIRVNHGPLIYIFNGPQLHRWHHHKAYSKCGVNFATKLSLWDWLWGTAYLPEKNVLPEYGLQNPNYPSYNYLKQLILIFRPFRSKKIGSKKLASHNSFLAGSAE
ncbi:MAG: sterol desaturase family protein [Bacteroidetes bacterium]|nr:sterol desaturase family protein [Bacteroidota bacterium]